MTLDKLRPLQKFAYREKFTEETEHSTAAYVEDRADASLGSTPKLPLEVEFLKRSIEKLAAKSSILVTPIIVKDYLAYKVEPNFLLPLLKALKESEELRFTVLTDLFGADFPERDKRFEVIYNLLSLKLNKRLIIKVSISEKESIPSAMGIFNAACWYEREVYDMYGVNFDGNDDKRRILTDYEFEGHPLRKDFPLTGYTQVKYDENTKKVAYEPVNLDIEYREFDFSSHWHSPNYVLPGDEKVGK